MQKMDIAANLRADDDWEEDPSDVWRFLAVLLLERKTAFWVTVVVGALGLTLVALGGLERTYTAQASFIPQGSEPGRTQLAGLAGQFGISIPTGGGASLSPEFYAELIRSRRLLSDLADTRFSMEMGNTTVEQPLYRLLSEPDEDGPAVRENVIAELSGEHLQVSVGRETGLVQVSTTFEDSRLARDVLERVLELVTEFNVSTRQSQATAERQFVEARLATAQAGLMDAEGQLMSFMENNRSFANSPELRFRNDRLERQVAMRQEVVTSLTQRLEQAKVDEVRNTPVVTVVERPEAPVQPDPRGLLQKIAFVAILAPFTGIGVALLRIFLDTERSRGSSGFREFKEVVRQIRRGESA